MEGREWKESRVGSCSHILGQVQSRAVYSTKKHTSICVPVFYNDADKHVSFVLQWDKSDLVRTQSLNVHPLKPGVGQHIAIHATLTARDFFLAYFYTSGPFTCIFSKNLS